MPEAGRSKPDRVDQILDAALRLFAREGFHAASMDDLVAESGLSKGSLYWYFESKDDIVFGVLKRMFEAELQGLEQLTEQDGPAHDRLMAMVGALAQEIHRMEHLLPLVYEFYAVLARREAVRGYLQAYFRRYRDLLAELVEQGVERGEFRAHDTERTAITLAGIVEGVTLLWVVDPANVDWEPQTRSAVQQVLRAIEPVSS